MVREPVPVRPAAVRQGGGVPGGTLAKLSPPELAVDDALWSESAEGGLGTLSGTLSLARAESAGPTRLSQNEATTPPWESLEPALLHLDLRSQEARC